MSIQGQPLWPIQPLTQKIVRRVVDPIDELRVPLSVGSPKNDDLVQIVIPLEVGNVLSDPLDVLPLVISGDDVVRTVFLIGGDKVGVVDRRQGRAHLLHERSDLTLEIVIEHLSSRHGLIHGHARDVPTTETKIVGVDHGKHVIDGDIDILASLGVRTDPDRRSSDERSDIVGLDRAELGRPGDVVLVGEDSGRNSGSVVTTDSDQHQAVSTIW